MSRLLRPLAPLVVALMLLASARPAGASYGGGYGGASGSGIWALSWWAGNPSSGGPYTGEQASAVDLCSWHDVGPSVADFGEALSQSSLPSSFWTVPRSGGHAGIWGVLEWATRLAAGGRGTDHFDLVACPSYYEVPANGGDIESDIPRAHPPGGGSLYIWAFFDTVVDPAARELPPIVKVAYDATGLPSPVISTSPRTIDGVDSATVVNLPTWLWIDRSIWHRYEARASAGGLVATVWAYPKKVTWSASWYFASPASNPEHGVSLGPERLDRSCPGPGEPYRPGASPSSPGACTAVFEEPTFGTRRSLEAAVTWVVHWAISSPRGVVGGEGLYGEVTTRSEILLRVMQVESIITAG